MKCGSPGIYCSLILLLASQQIRAAQPASSAFETSSSRVVKNGILFSRLHVSWGPYPEITQIPFPTVLISITTNSKSSPYSCIRIGSREICAPIKVPPSFFLSKCLKCYKPVHIDFSSFWRLCFLNCEQTNIEMLYEILKTVDFLFYPICIHRKHI